MATISFDATHVTPNVGGSNTPVPAGGYVVAITKSEHKANKKGTGEVLNFDLSVQGGEFNGRPIAFSINWKNPSEVAQRIGHEQFSAICHATGVLQVMDTQQLHAIPFYVEVDLSADGKYNNMRDLQPLSNAPAVLPQDANPAPVQAPQAAPAQAPAMPAQAPVQAAVQAAPAFPPQQAQAPAFPPQQTQAPVQPPAQAAPPADDGVPAWIKNQQG